jgi:transmembrane sensor
VSTKVDGGTTSRETFDAALRWFDLLGTNDLSERKTLEWLKWYEASEENSRAFDELQELRGLTRQLLGSTRGATLSARLQQHRWWHRWMWRAESWATTAFSSLFVSPLVIRRSALACGAALAVAAVIVARAVLVPPDAGAPTSVVAPSHRLVTAMTLPDDSRIELAPRTAIEVAYTSSERRLDMGAGEAHFVVAHQKGRPFIVHADALRIRAVGTRFNVHRSRGRVEVTVIEGKIDIYRETGAGTHVAAGTVFHVPAGNRFTAANGADVGSVATVDAEGSLDWRDGRLSYENVPLESVVADLNRYVTKPIVIEDAAVRSVPYTGSLLIDAIDEWLSAIAKEFQLTVVKGDDSIKLIRIHEKQPGGR